MGLRPKLLLLTALVLAASAVSIAVLYEIACQELERSAELWLAQTATLLARKGRQRLDSELANLEVMATMPLVLQTVLDDRNPELKAEFERYFAHVRKPGILQSIFLINCAGECIASDHPDRVFHPHSRDVVSRRPGSLAAFAGTPSIDTDSVVSLATGRLVLPMTAPVRHGGAVVAILRAGIDLGRFNEELLADLQIGRAGRAYAFVPEMAVDLPPPGELHAPIDWIPYHPPPIAIPPDIMTIGKGVFLHVGAAGDRQVVALHRLENPNWVFLATLPVEEVRAPARNLRGSMWWVLGVTAGLLLLLVPAVANPVIDGIRRCQNFAEDLAEGRLESRIHRRGRDEVGQLADALNRMARAIHTDREALAGAERRYRTIFENAIEGLFQSNEQGDLQTGNPALARIVGAASVADCLKHNVAEFYAEPAERRRMLDILRRQGSVSGFEFDLRRLDGSIRHCSLHAWAEAPGDSSLGAIQGILQDNTERCLAEATRKRIERAELLAARARLEALHYQVNPHFLFNVLNTLDILSRKKPERVSELLQNLACYLRYAIEPGPVDLRTFDDEIVALEAYLAVEQARFAEHLDATLAIAAGVRSVNVPGMLLQPLVGNAIKHGMRTSSMPLRIRVSAQVADQRLRVDVRNSGRWTEPDANRGRSGVGLENLQERLRLFYQGDFSFATRESDGWVIVEISLPLGEASLPHAATGATNQPAVVAKLGRLHNAET